MELLSFDPASAPTVSSWARSPDEVDAWCSRAEAPVPAEVIAGWSAPDDVLAFGLVDDGALVAYGELWLDEDEAEVELARLIVAPEHRGRGVGRQFVTMLTRLARTHQPTTCMRVHPANAAARRCYESAGFERVSPDEEAEWNIGQPRAYVWMRAVSVG